MMPDPSADIDRHLFVVLGGSGDLMGRKLLPALYHIQDRLDDPKICTVLGVARSSDLDDESYRDWARTSLREADFPVERGDPWVEQALHYHPMGRGEDRDYDGLVERMEEIEQRRDLPGNRVFYLALPPGAFPDTITRLGEVGLNHGPGWTRLVVEKPFGRDLESSRELNDLVHQYYDERQIYRIDHYLGKETVQNLLIFRFSNPIFESLWNRQYVDNVQVTVSEQLGVGTRAGYYDRTGALRDMVQNHLTQLLTLTTMEAPTSFDADAIRDEKVKVLRSVASIPEQDVVLGQYRRGEMEGEPAPGYREEEDVETDSRTETYAGLKLRVDNWRWNGVPFYLRTGKRMPRKLTRIDVVFREPPICLFQNQDRCEIESNVLRITLQPEEGFSLYFQVKMPGDPMRLKTLPLQFRYEEAFEPLPDAYHTLIRDILEGDQTLFVRADEVEAAWKLFTPVIENPPRPRAYEVGTWGPPEGDRLLEHDGRQWHTP